jgi:hypothetical protein
MIAITIISSTNVNPRLLVVFVPLSYLLLDLFAPPSDLSLVVFVLQPDLPLDSRAALDTHTVAHALLRAAFTLV